MDDDLHAAVAAGVVGVEEAHRDLLRSIVEVARAIFAARAASIFLLDEERDELVFEAVAGEGSEELVGRRFPSSTGVAGWTLVTRQPLLLDDVRADPRFGREAAESTGYVPNAIMSVPLLHGERALGVLQVLDRAPGVRADLMAMDLLALFAGQAGIALELLQRARRAQAVLDGRDGLAALARLAGSLERSDRGPAGRELVAVLERLLAPAPADGDELGLA